MKNRHTEKHLRTYKQIFENCSCMHIRKTARQVTQFYDAMLEPVGITSTQLTLLVTIFLCQSRTQKEIGEALAMSASSLTRTLKPLLDHDLIEVEISDNKRAKQLSLTERGAQTLRLATPLWEQAQEVLVAKIGESDWQDLIEKLANVSQLPTVIAD